MLSRYRKLITAEVTGLIGWATAVVVSTSGPITAAEWVGLATVLAIGAGVYVAPNANA